MKRCFALSPPAGSPLVTLLVFFLVGIAPAAKADIYKYIDKYGGVHLTDKPEHAGYRLWSAARAHDRRSVRIGSNKKNRARFSPLIAKAAHRYQLPHALLHAVITAESAYNPLAISHKGAVGLMQLMPDTARRYGVRNLTDPMANLQGGSRYLRDLLRMFKQNLRLALAAYNAGENAVIWHGYKIPPYQEMTMLVTHIGAAAGSMAWMLIEWARQGKPSVLGMVTGMVAGLGTITPASGYVGPLGALVIGSTAGFICFFATNFMKRTLRVDDSLDVFPVHAVGGMIGTTLTGVFAAKALGGVGFAEGVSMV